MSKQFLAGIHPVESALDHDPGNVIEVYVERGSQNTRVTTLVERARAAGIAVQGSDRAALERMADGARHQGIVASYRPPPPRGEQDLLPLVDAAGDQALVLVLDGVTDPHNLGACLRSAEAAGVCAVVVPRDKAVGLTPTVRRASAGAADRVPVIAVANLARSLRTLKDAGVWLVGLAGDGERSIHELTLTGPLAIIMGSEGQGMRRLTREACDFTAFIPMRGSVESLNVSVATGVVLFEALRQRA